ncbi:MAG: HAD family phosphatase [Labilithrix sp.]|nr:HAD family phosphatase [Labilithrix sp.]
MLATDYDGTLAEDGRVAGATLEALRRAKAAGITLVLVTGRELDELQGVFPELDVFDTVVAENGALLYTPQPDAQAAAVRLLATAPPPAFAQTLVARGVGPISCGRVIVATWEPHQHVVLETIREMGLELEVIFNKGAVMVLPTGVNKASGLRAALLDFALEASQVVGIGDAENDHSLLNAAGLGVAVANAVPALKERADLTMSLPRGAGVVELLESMMRNGLAGIRRAPREIAAPAVPIVVAATAR